MAVVFVRMLDMIVDPFWVVEGFLRGYTGIAPVRRIGVMPWD